MRWCSCKKIPSKKEETVELSQSTFFSSFTREIGIAFSMRLGLSALRVEYYVLRLETFCSSEADVECIGR